MTMILDSEKLNPQYNQNSVLTMPWIALGVPGPPPPDPPLATGLTKRTHRVFTHNFDACQPIFMLFGSRTLQNICKKCM